MHDQGVARALLEEIGEEFLGEPLAAGCDRRVQADSREVVREVLHVLDPGAADERRRALGEDADDLFDEALARLALGDENLDGELLHAAWKDRDRLDL